jgi:aspartyl-tRNA(Asn)/glutamyl-tRNA(Gln) amidotransferase subunit A
VSRAADATAIRARILAGETSVEATIDRTLERIAALDPEIGAFRAVFAERALDRARELDRALARGAPSGPLFGLPLAIKGNMCLEGEIADCGSRILEGWRAPYTATFVARAIEAGAVPIGTTHMDEFAMGSSGENSAFGVPRNPWDPRRTCGGSSSGAAAAVASGMVPLALGSDTGGSVRQPAALCGISGMKPTYGRVSRHGLIAFASSLDQVSPLARSVRDLELVFQTVGGHDARDATSLSGPFPAPEPRDDLAGLAIGVPDGFFGPGLDPAVRARTEAALAVLAELGAELRPLALAGLDRALATYYVIATAEASSNLARFAGVGFGLRAAGDGTLRGMMAASRSRGFGPEVKRRILLGTYVLSSGYYDAWYGRASRARAALGAELARAFRSADLIVGPTSPTPAFALGERARDPVAMYQSDVLTVPASLAGLPAASVPCGFATADGVELPIGLQIVGARGADARVLSVARLFQERTGHHLALPALAVEEEA